MNPFITSVALAEGGNSLQNVTEDAWKNSVDPESSDTFIFNCYIKIKIKCKSKVFINNITELLPLLFYNPWIHRDFNKK